MKHGEVGHSMDNLLSDHGHCHIYHYKIGKEKSPECMYYPDVTDTAKQTIFACGKCHAYRDPLVLEVS